MKNLIYPRERKIVECFDLAIVVCRRFWRPLVVASLPGLLVILLLNYMLRHIDFTHDQGVNLYIIMVVLLHPLLSAPVTWYLGQAVFSRPATAALCLAALRRGFMTFFVYGLLVRALYMVLVVTFLFYPNYVLEVAMLEQQGLRASHRRITSLGKASHQSPAPWYLLYALVATLFIVFSAWCLAELWQVLRYQVGFQGGFGELLLPSRTVMPTLLYWPIGIYLTVVRFIGYLDLRTRVEGWAIEQQFRTLAEELVHAPR